MSMTLSFIVFPSSRDPRAGCVSRDPETPFLRTEVMNGENGRSSLAEARSTGADSALVSRSSPDRILSSPSRAHKSSHRRSADPIAFHVPRGIGVTALSLETGQFGVPQSRPASGVPVSSTILETRALTSPRTMTPRYSDFGDPNSKPTVSKFQRILTLEYVHTFANEFA